MKTFEKFIDGVIAFKKLAYSHRLNFQKADPIKGITQPENDSHAGFADSQLDVPDPKNNKRKTAEFEPYGKAAPPENDQSIHQFLKTKGHDNKGYEKHRDSKVGQKDHLLDILNNTHYFFGARVHKDKQAKINRETTGLSDQQADEIDSIDHGLNESQLHALTYLDSHDILKDAPPVVSDRYQQSRYFDLMRQEIANKQASSGQAMVDDKGAPVLDKDKKPMSNPKWELTKASLNGIHERVRKSLLPEMSGDGRFGSDSKSQSGKLTAAQTVDMFPPVIRGMIKGAASFVGLFKNTKPDDTMMPLKPEGKNGEFTNEQLKMLDQDLGNKGGYSPTDNANFTRMWHAVMHQEVWNLIDGTTIGTDKSGKAHSSTEKMAMYHEFGGRGVIERLAEAKLVEARKKGPSGDKEQAAIEDERMRALVALGLTFATDHVAQSLVSEGQGKTSGGDSKGFLILPNGDWKEYKNKGDKEALTKLHNAAHDSGALWYDDDMAQTDSNIIRMLNLVNKETKGWKKIDELGDTIPPTDSAGNQQNLYLTCFKALMAPTSFGMQPGANLGVALKMYLQAVTDKKADKGGKSRSVFSYISTKQDESSDPDGVVHLNHENKLYGRAKAVSNSMEILDPRLYESISALYASEDKEKIKKAIHLQKEWLRLEHRDILIQDEDAKLRPPQKNPKDGEEEEEKAKLIAVHIRKNSHLTDSISKIRNAAKDDQFVVPSGKEAKEDDLDMTVKGALKKPSLSALTRNNKRGDNQSMINKWADKAATSSETNTWSDLHRDKLKSDLKNMEFSSDDLQKDWTTRGGSINPMLRFIKNYSLAFGKDGDSQLAAFLQGSHSAKFMAQEWAKYSFATDEEGKNSFQVDMEEANELKDKDKRAKRISDVKEDYVKFLKKIETKFVNAAPAGLRGQIKQGSMGVSGSYIFGPKGGNFHQDLSYNGGYPTKDLWYTRWMLWGMGTMTNKSGKLTDTPPTQLAGVFDLINNFTAKEFGMTNKQVQAIGWYHWKNFCTRMGVKTAGMENYTSASKKHYDKMVGKETKMPNIPKGEANKYATDNPNGPPANGAGVSHNFSAANLARAYAVLGKGNSTLERQPFTMGGASGRTRQQAKGKGKTRLPRRGGRVVKLAQFTQAPGGMTGTPVATRTNQPFSNAVAKSPGGKNLAQGALGNQVNAKGGVNSTAQNAVGDWPNGSEESIVHTAPQGTDPRRLKYLAAWHGISGQKKSVLVFHPNPKGPDSLYHIEHPSTDMGEVREQLIAAGINYKTLLPGKTSTKVMVYDPNRGMRNTVDQFATNNNLNVEENIGQGEIVGHNGDWNSAGALPKSRQAYQNIIGEYEQNSNQAGSTNNTSGAPTNGTSSSTGQAQQLSRKTTTKAKIKFDRSRRILEGFLRAHNTPNKELPPVGELLSQDLQQIKPEHLSKYQQLIPDAKWSDIEGAVSSLNNDPGLYDDMTSEGNRREMYCKEHARTVLQSSGLKKLIDSLQVQQLIPEHAQHLIEDAKDGDYFSLEAISSELEHGVPSLRAFAKAAEKEYNKAGKVWDKMRTVQPQKFAKKKSAHAKDQYRAGKHGVNFRGAQYNGGQFAPKDDGVKRFQKDSNLTHMIKQLRGV